MGQPRICQSADELVPHRSSEQGWALLRTGLSVIDELPPTSAWRHHGPREGLEVLFTSRTRRGWRLDGVTTAVEAGSPWTVRYSITVDRQWATLSAVVSGTTQRGSRRRTLRRFGASQWTVDGEWDPALDGCVDVDLESSACTNTLPVHRLSLPSDAVHDRPAAYVRALDLGVERLEQTYQQRPSDNDGMSFDYRAPQFGFNARLTYDRFGLVVDYPGIAARVETTSDPFWGSSV